MISETRSIKQYDMISMHQKSMYNGTVDSASQWKELSKKSFADKFRKLTKKVAKMNKKKAKKKKEIGSKNMTQNTNLRVDQEEIERRRKEKQIIKGEFIEIIDGDPFPANYSYIRTFKRKKNYVSYWSKRLDELLKVENIYESDKAIGYYELFDWNWHLLNYDPNSKKIDKDMKENFKPMNRFYISPSLGPVYLIDKNYGK